MASGGKAVGRLGKQGLAALLVERDEAYAGLVGDLLRRVGGTVERLDAEEAAGRVRAGAFDVALIDSEARLRDGRSLLRALREEAGAARLPLIALSSVEGDEETVRRVMERADYELVKPFSPRRLYAAVRVVVERGGRVEPGTPGGQPDLPPDELRIGALQLNQRLLEVHVGERRVPLSPREYSLLYVLAASGGAALTRDELAVRAWGWQPSDDSRAVDNAVRRLRRKLGDDAREPRLLLTERGVGYRLLVR